MINACIEAGLPEPVFEEDAKALHRENKSADYPN